MGTLHEDQYTFPIMCHSVSLTMRNVSHHTCRAIKTHFVLSIFFFFRIRAVYDTVWNNTLEPGMPQITIWRMCIAC